MSDEKIEEQFDQLTLALAKQFAMEPGKFREAIINQCLGGSATSYQITQFLMVAANRKLNPFEAQEIYAYVNRGKLTIGTGIDGWIKIAHRHPDFRGYKATDVFEGDHFVGVHMEMYRQGWEHPGEYTAYLEEWKTDKWGSLLRHRCFTKAWQECVRFTFDVTDVVSEEDIDRIRSANAENVDQPIYQPGPAEPRVIEHNPPEVANFTNTQRPEPEPVHTNAAQPTGHLRVHVELPEQHQSEGGGKQTQPVAPAEVPSTPVVAEDKTSTAGSSPAPPTKRGRPAGSKNKLRAEPEPLVGSSIGWVACEAPDCHFAATQKITETLAGLNGDLCDQHAKESLAAAKQVAASLEVIDPNESELETFIRVHDLDQKRVDAMLAKYGADNVKELSPADAARALEIFRKSVAVMEAAQR